ncbi:MAG: LysR family transcriptional regulator [Chloroflexi bacterium]|nr:LysR family transcriptional regulator [Chloroflexota bacterium]
MSCRFSPALLRNLQTFLAVVDEGGFSAAARRLGITQPSVSEQVRALEEHFGQPLFERVGRAPTLTVAGRRVQEHAGRIVLSLEALERDLAALRDGTVGVVTLVASPVPGESVVPTLLPLFQARHPGSVVRMAIADTRSAIGRLLRRDVELAVIGGPFRHERCRVEVLGRNELVPIAPAGHPLLELDHLTAAQLAGEPLVLREEGSGVRATVTAAFEAAGVPPERVRVVAELGSTEAVMTAVAAGLGIGFVSGYALMGDGTGRPLRVPRIIDFAPGRDMLLVSERGRALSAAAGAFRDFLLSEAIRARIAASGRVPPALVGAGG